MGMNIRHYVPGPMDYQVLLWHSQMMRDMDEMETTFTRPMQTPSVFLAFFQAPRQLFFVDDACENIGMAAWIEPSGDVMYLGYWTAPQWRHTKASLRFFADVADAATKNAAVVVGLLKERVAMQAYINLHQRLGYQVCGTLPSSFNGASSTIVYLTRDNFLKSRLYAARQRIP